MTFAKPFTDFIFRPATGLFRRGTRRFRRLASSSEETLGFPALDRRAAGLAIGGWLIFAIQVAMISLVMLAIVLFEVGLVLVILTGLSAVGGVWAIFPGPVRRLEMTVCPWASSEVVPGDLTIYRLTGLVTALLGLLAIVIVAYGYDIPLREAAGIEGFSSLHSLSVEW